MWLTDILTECAWAAARSRNTYLSAQYWRLSRRIGKKKAAVAVGHSILVICWHLLTNNTDYHDLGGDYFTRRGNTTRHQDHLIQQLQDLGYQVTLRRSRRNSRLILLIGRNRPRAAQVVNGRAWNSLKRALPLLCKIGRFAVFAGTARAPPSHLRDRQP